MERLLESLRARPGVFPRARAHAAALALVGAALLSGCAAISRPPITVPQLQQDAVQLSAKGRALRDSIIERLVRRAVTRGDGTLDVLMLSGGGQNGAFGAGFLRGWAQRTDAPMPRFDLITGISTGALQAPYALLGTKASLDTISALYARAATSIAPTIDWWFWLRRTGGVVNTTRFDRTLATTINGPFRDALREAFLEDRQLIFATTDYDLGIGQLWSMGDALDTSAAGLARTGQLLKAATAIPGIFPSVMIDGHLHGDGGVIENVLATLTFDDYEQLAARLAARGMHDVKVRVWVVMNMWTHPAPRVITPSNRKAITSRSNTMLFFAHQPATLQALEDLSRAVTSQIPQLHMDVRVALLAAAESLSPGAQKLFEAKFMQRLDSLGYAKSQQAMPWDRIPSAFRRPETDRR